MANRFKLFVRQSEHNWEVWVAWQSHGPFDNPRQALRNARKLGSDFGNSEVIVVRNARSVKRKSVS